MVVETKTKLQRSEYRGYIASEEWQKTRKRYWRSSLPKYCYVCKADGEVLDLHHRSYKTLGKENLNHLVLVCRPCHDSIHETQKREGIGIWAATKKVRKRFQKWSRGG